MLPAPPCQIHLRTDLVTGLSRKRDPAGAGRAPPY